MYKSIMIAATMLVMLVISSPTKAASNQTIKPSPYFIGLVVSNVDTSEKWYQQALALNTIHAEELPQYGMSLRILGLDNFMLEMFSHNKAVVHKDFLPAEQQQSLNIGLLKFGFQVANIEQFKQQLISKNIALFRDITDDKTIGHRYLFLQDPDGNLIQVFQPNPIS